LSLTEFTGSTERIAFFSGVREHAREKTRNRLSSESSASSSVAGERYMPHALCCGLGVASSYVN